MPDLLATPTREAGLAQAGSFLGRAGLDYAKSRNYDFGADRRGNVSLMSPWLRHRLVLENEMLERVLERHSFSSAQKFIEEVFWRAYFKGWLEQHSRVWSDYRAWMKSGFEQLDAKAELHDAFKRATDGKTGIDCFDAWARELTDTGYLHNHARMWFASIWVFTLKLPWQLGADFLLRNLLDGDPASNTLSWRWVSGLHTVGKTYLARASNIEKYTEGRFNPEGQLASTAPALTEGQTYSTEPLPEASELPDDQRFGLLITEDDCAPEIGLLPRPPAAIMGLTATQLRSPLRVAEHACEFAAGAVSDSLSRAEETYGVGGVLVGHDEWEGRVIEWANANNIRFVVTPYVPVGPVRDFLNAASRPLKEHGIEMLHVRRRFDELCWPNATRGYFKLKKKIPVILEQLEPTQK
ncbi:MAG: DNA photolyase [Gammaproteobacteria bacterium]|nr:DNA photolyase [Gammaproteobacteria bacterium]